MSKVKNYMRSIIHEIGEKIFPEPPHIMFNTEPEEDFVARITANKRCETWGDIDRVVEMINLFWRFSHEHNPFATYKDVYSVVECLEYIIDRVPLMLKCPRIRLYLESKIPSDNVTQGKTLKERIEYFKNLTSLKPRQWPYTNGYKNDFATCLHYILTYETGLSDEDLVHLSNLVFPPWLKAVGKNKKAEWVKKLIADYSKKLSAGIYAFQGVVVDNRIERVAEVKLSKHFDMVDERNYSVVCGFWPYGCKPVDQEMDFTEECIKYPFYASVESLPLFFLEKIEEHLNERLGKA